MATSRRVPSHAHHLDHVLEHFDELREIAIEDLTRYTSSWAAYTVDFLNAVAEIQGSDARLEPRSLARLANGRKRLADPKVARLLRDARDARSMRVEEIIGRIAEECDRLPARRRARYKDVFRP